MKLLALFLFITLVTPYTFQNYIAQFNKVYPTEEERTQREQLFLQKMSYYQKWNSENSGYTLGPSIWTDRTQEEKRALLTVKFNSTGVSSEFKATKSGLKVQASGYKDWRGTGVSAVKDQGSCGSCWAFTSIATLQSYFLLKNNTNYDLSEEYVLECTLNGSSCSGGYIDKAMQLLVRTGAPLETRYPYTAYTYGGATFPNTNGICQADSTFKKGYSNTSMNAYYNNSKTRIMSLIDQGPVSSLIIADDNLQGYQSNIARCDYTYTDDDINHAVQLVGYNVTGNYYIIKNSWGTRWGIDGFAYVDMDQDCAISRALYQLVWGPYLQTALLVASSVILIYL